MKGIAIHRRGNAAAKVTTELNIHLGDSFHKKSDESLTNPKSMVGLQLLNLLLLKTAFKDEKDGVMIIKPGHLMSGNT